MTLFMGPLCENNTNTVKFIYHLAFNFCKEVFYLSLDFTETLEQGKTPSKLSLRIDIKGEYAPLLEFFRMHHHLTSKTKLVEKIIEDYVNLPANRELFLKEYNATSNEIKKEG